MREIAGRFHRAASTVSREVARHDGRPAYRADHRGLEVCRNCLYINVINTSLLYARRVIS
jgi:hypothetical protein